MSNDRDIPLGNGYHLINDPYCYWIEREYVSKKNGKVYRKNLSMYHISIENAFNSLSDYHISQFDAESVRELIKEVRKLKKEIKRMIKELDHE